MHARERLYLTADKSKLVGYGDPKAAFLYAAEGDEIPATAVEKFGLVDGGLKPARTAKPKVTVVETLTHLERAWSIVQIDGSFFARDDKDSDTGPYSTANQARGWVLAIVPATSPEKPETSPTKKPETTQAPKPEKAEAKKAPAKKAPAKKAKRD